MIGQVNDKMVDQEGRNVVHIDVKMTSRLGTAEAEVQPPARQA